MEFVAWFGVWNLQQQIKTRWYLPIANRLGRHQSVVEGKKPVTNLLRLLVALSSNQNHILRTRRLNRTVDGFGAICHQPTPSARLGGQTSDHGLNDGCWIF